MNISQEKIEIANLEIDIIRKKIKNMHLAVYPPTGRIRLSAPLATDYDVMRMFAISKLGWIKMHIKNFEEQARERPRMYVSGESHFFEGKRYLLKVIEQKKGAGRVELNGVKYIYMYVRSTTSEKEKARLMREWYRAQLKERIPALLEKWEAIMGVQSKDWMVKLMKTKWGTCNIEQKRIWLNLELAKKPTLHLEYVIVHELTHLLERNHNERFVQYLNQFMPKWRLHRAALNALPLGDLEE